MLEGKKTYIAAGGAVLIAVGKTMVDFAEGADITTDIQIVVSGLIALAMIFLRKGIKTEIRSKEIYGGN